MREVLHSLALAGVLFLASVSAHASGWLKAVTPSDSQVGGFAFGVSTEKIADGAVKFRVVVSEKGAHFGSEDSTTLSRVEILETSGWSVSAVRILSHERKAGSIVCVFSVSEASLDDLYGTPRKALTS